MIEVTGAFATRWMEEWRLAGDIEGRVMGKHQSYSGDKRQIELFLDRYGPEIINVLLGPIAAAAVAVKDVPKEHP